MVVGAPAESLAVVMVDITIDVFLVVSSTESELSENVSVDKDGDRLETCVVFPRRGGEVLVVEAESVKKSPGVASFVGK